ncbi:MAG: acyl-phosphate glycerol 3-phosphate acyltransferase [Cryobacterium sp.]|nr:acyl-phosphate glycerol 3-phosphate acyltransferase [Cryobacterium sp.]
MPDHNPASQPVAPALRDRRETATPSIFWVLAGLVLPVMNLAAKYEVEGRDNFPRSGAFVLAPNHYTEIDPVVMGVVSWKLGRAPRFLAKGSLFTIPVLGWVLRKSGQIPVERGGSLRGAGPVEAAQRLVEKGQEVVVYPEGSLTRDPDLWPMRGKSGAVRIALEHGIPVIPAAHWGAQELMGRYSKKVNFFPRKTVRIKIGPPVDFSALRDRPLDSATLTEATGLVMDAITRLLEDLRGDKAPAVRWNPADNDQRETGRFEA